MRPAFLMGALFLVTACAPSGEDPRRASGTGEGAASVQLGSGVGAGGSGTGVGANGVGGGSAPVAMADVGTLVVLGDSIGDGGGQPPYYYQLLPDELSTHYGKSVDVVNHAQSGSQTGALLGQIDSLPSALIGPVAVVITSGGNDMKDHLAQILTGTDGPARVQMGDNVEAALGALLEPDRFGSGVEVRAFYANIYDASDGEGNFAEGGCVISVNSPSPTGPFFASWNDEIEARVDGAAQTLVDMHATFFGHGFNHPPNWYAGDCTHPNSTGHAELAALFHQRITGAPVGD